MSTNKIQSGAVLDWDNETSVDVESGDAVVIGDRIGIAVVDIDADDSGSVDFEGVYKLDKKSTDTWDQGDVLYWDDTNDYLTTTSSGNTVAGFAAEAGASAKTTGKVKLNA